MTGVPILRGLIAKGNSTPTTISSVSYAPNFDPIARLYRWLEYLTLGPALQRCRTHFLPQLHERRHALVLGDGDGRFLAALLRANLNIKADAVDTSPAMLTLLRQRCEAITTIRLRTHNHSALEHSPKAETDLIAAHFFFDCLTQPELDTLILRLARYAQPHTFWLISDFRIPPGPLSFPARLYIRALYFAFRLLTGLRTTHLPDHETSLKSAGLTRTHQHLSLFGLITTELWTHSDLYSNSDVEGPCATFSKASWMVLPARECFWGQHPPNE